MHNNFHVSKLQKFLADDSTIILLDDISLSECLNYVERPIDILERKTQTLQSKEVGLVKMQWQHHKVSEWT